MIWSPSRWPDELPPLAKDRYSLDGRSITRRSARMIREARFLLQVRDGGTPSYPRMSQGGFTNGNQASKGTHGRDAADDSIATKTKAVRLVWEEINQEVGYCYWERDPILGVWVRHGHKIPKYGYLSEEAQGQQKQWFQGDNALVSDRDYPKIEKWGFKHRYWEQYLEHVVRRDVDSNQPLWEVDLSGLIEAFKIGKLQDPSQDAGDNDVKQVQIMLNHYLGRHIAEDGIPGPVTKSHYALFQSRAFNVPKWSPDANGIPGPASIKSLSLKGRS